MAIRKFRIDNIQGGISDTFYDQSLISYTGSLGIDPDLPVRPVSLSIPKTSGQIMPSAYAKFSGTEVDGYPLWIVTQPKTENSFVYTTTGDLHSFDNTLVMRATDEAGTAFPIVFTGGAGNGLNYYNNFIYVMEGADVSQYGGMDQGASIAETENVWTGAKFGKAALTNTTYPTIRATALPNHPGHVHQDNALYFGDVIPAGFATLSSRGRGTLHKLQTKQTTIQGDTDDGSIYGAVLLPFGYVPTDIESLPNGDLAIACIQSSGSSSPIINQGVAAVFFWDTFQDIPYRQIECPDPIITALKNVNGSLYVFSGSSVSGSRVSRLGTYSMEEVAFFEEGVSPFAGAVDALGQKITFGGYTTYPNNSVSVFAIGSKKSSIPEALHNIAATTSTGSNGVVTSLKYVQQNIFKIPQLVIGWGDDSAKGLDKFSSSGTILSSFRKVFPIGSGFQIQRLVVGLTESVTSNVSITPKFFIDNESSSVTLTAINNTNYPDQVEVVYKNTDLKSVRGSNNFSVSFQWGSTQPAGIAYFEVWADIIEDEKA